ncbi:hypothetical protein IT411_00115 [Candidatus Peregrinibacteria bacterium]|nr:hypothetical protein [Candidatus Peregrinibacteria bacterium]
MEDQILEIIKTVTQFLIILTFIVYVLGGIFYLYRAVRYRNLEMGLIALIGLLAFLVGFIPLETNFRDIFYLGILILMLILVFKMYFGDLLKKGTSEQKITLIIGILIILAALFLGLYTKRPEFLDYIPSF